MTDQSAFSAALVAPESEQHRLYRRTAITTDHIRRFVSCLLREWLEHDGIHYDAVYVAFGESGIQPLPSLQCDRFHFETRLQRLNHLADVLVATIATDESVQTAISGIATAVINQLTVPAPDEHLTQAELRELLVCCESADDGHISDYELYAVRHAHVGVCTRCDFLLRAMNDDNGSN